MNANSPVVFQQSTHQRPDHPEQYSAYPRQVRLPVIPDLRFEYSYLRSIQRYVTIRRPKPSDPAEREHEDPGLEEVGRPKEHESTLSKASVPSEVIHIQWDRVAWITTRDQVITPLLQGALWALASYFLTPFSAQLGTKMGTFAHTRLAPSKEGSGVGWLRGWISGLGLGTSANPTIRRS